MARGKIDRRNEAKESSEFCFMNTKKLPIEFNIRLERDARKIKSTQ